MDTENQATSEQAVQINQSETKKCKHVPIIVVLVILAVCGFAFGGFELYQNIDNKSQSCNTECGQDENKNVVENDDIAPKNMVTGSASFAVPNPPFDEGTYDGTVKFEYGIYDDTLFAYSINYRLHPYGHIISEVISNNIDINTGEKLSNTEALERVDVTMEEVYRKILGNIVDTVSVDSFLLNTRGDVNGEAISIDDFKNNTNEYVETLKSNQDLFYVFLKDSKVAVSYEQYKILEKLGMSSHMNSGLVGGYVEVEL